MKGINRIITFFICTLGSFILNGQISPPPIDYSCEENLFEELFEEGVPIDWEVDAGALYTGPLGLYPDYLAGWYIHTGPTDSDDTGPDEAFEGSYYAYCEGSGPIGRGETVTLTSPPIDLSISAVINLSFQLNMHGPSASLAVNVIEGGVITNVLAPVTGGIHTSSEWEEIYVDISEWRNKSIQIQFEAIKPDAGLNGDISIDALRVCGSLANLPTLSEWGVIILGLSLLIIGVVAMKHYNIILLES